MTGVIKRMKPLLGTYVEVAVAGSRLSAIDTHHLINQAFYEIELIQRLMSFHDKRSDLSRINRARGEWVKVHQHVIQVLKMAIKIMHESQHGFNCTVGGQLVLAGALPRPPGITRDFYPVGDASDIEINYLHVRLRRKVLITLDGIAKGYAVDLAANCLECQDIEGYWINAGGDIRTGGDVELMISHQDENDHLKHLGVLKNCCVASSHVKPYLDVDYPAYLVGSKQFAKEGVYTVKAKKTWLADALTKVAAFSSSSVVEAMLKEKQAQILLSPQ